MAAAAHRRAAVDEDQRVFFRIGWKTYETVDASRGESSVPRLAYLDGVMEAVVPGKRHESTARLIGRLLEVWADENGLPIEGTKSWTLKNPLKEAGAEADESWVVGDRPNARLPDLALEVVRTHGGLDKLEIYARLGVREVWFWIDDALSVHVLRGGRYVRAARSNLFRSLDLSLLAQFAKHSSPARAPLMYHAALQRAARKR